MPPGKPMAGVVLHRTGVWNPASTRLAVRSWRRGTTAAIPRAPRTGASAPFVVFVTHSGALSGAELALARQLPALDGIRAHVLLGEDGPLAEVLARAGVTVEVVPLSSRTRELRRDAIRVRRLPWSAIRDTLSWTRRLRARIRELDADVVQTESMKAHLAAGLAARSLGRPHICRAHDRLDEAYLDASGVRLLRLALRALPSHVLANSRSTLESLRLPRRVSASIVPIGVPPVAAPRRTDSGPLVVGHLGRLTPWKGQDVFLRAFARAFPDGPERALVVGAALFGEDDYARRLQTLAAELGIADRVRFTGFRSDTAAELARMDVLVHSSVIPEPFGQVVVEGMSAGLPVVASQAGGPTEIVDPGRTGFLTPPGDVDALADTLRLLAADPALRARVGAAARVAADAYAPERVAGLLLATYRALLR